MKGRTSFKGIKNALMSGIIRASSPHGKEPARKKKAKSLKEKQNRSKNTFTSSERRTIHLNFPGDMRAPTMTAVRLIRGEKEENLSAVISLA